MSVFQCSAYTYETNVLSTTPSSLTATNFITYQMGSNFGIAYIDRVQITVAPTSLAQIGTYNLTMSMCLTDYPAICMTTKWFTVNVTCGVTALKIVQLSDGSPLTDQSYIIPNATAFTY